MCMKNHVSINFYRSQRKSAVQLIWGKVEKKKKKVDDIFLGQVDFKIKPLKVPWAKENSKPSTSLYNLLSCIA